MEWLNKMDWLSKFEQPLKLDWLHNINWRKSTYVAGMLFGCAIVAAVLYAGVNKVMYEYQEWNTVYSYKCKDLRDNQRFRYRSDDKGQRSGKYQIRKGVYIDYSDQIKCEQRSVKR